MEDSSRCINASPSPTVGRVGPINGSHVVAPVCAGAKFGVMVERPTQKDQEAAARPGGS